MTIATHPSPLTVPALLAEAMGDRCEGDGRCFYCGAPADGSHPASFYVKDSFTGRNGVRAPGSPSVCSGCVLCLRESCDVDLIDGTRRTITKGAMRAWSWIVTRERAVAASKAHLEALRALCLSPPPPPFAIVLSDSGQTHQLYRGAVNHDNGAAIVVTLEAEPIHYRVDDLRTRLDLCGCLVAATGKPALSEEPSVRFGVAVMGRYPLSGKSLLDQWSRVRQSPLSRLAAWLCGNKELCTNEYPAESDAV